MDRPILSVRDTVEVALGERRFTLAPLSYLEKARYDEYLADEAGLYPGDAALLAALRQVVRTAGAANAEELLAAIEAAELEPENRAAQGVLALIEAQCAALPPYSDMLRLRRARMAQVPFIAAQWSLRGWDGPGLPPFVREGDMVPAALLDALPKEEVAALGGKALTLMALGPDALGNSASPSPSSASPAPAKEESSRRAGGSGSSPGRNGRRTRATASARAG